MKYLNFALFLFIYIISNCSENRIKKGNEFSTDPKQNKQSQKIPREQNKKNINLEGIYESNEANSCKMTLHIFRKHSKLAYKIITETQEKENYFTYEPTEDKKGYYLNFLGLKWNDYDGELDDNGEQINENLEIPDSVPAFISFENKNEILIQNTGNSMNYFVIFGECNAKYIHLIKK